MRKLAGPALLLTGALLLAGCSSSSPSGDGDASAGEIDPTAIVNINPGNEPSNLDVRATSGAGLTQLMRYNVYETLVGIDENFEIYPLLASEYEVSEDGLTYTFTIRDGVKFHDGSDLDVEDVVASLEEVTAPESVVPGATRMTAVDTIEATDDSTVVITLSNRDINFLETLTTWAGYIVSSENEVDLKSEANGTGPYTVAQWNQGSTITLEPNADYWGEAPKNGGVVMHYITDDTTRQTALRSGEIDMVVTASNDTANLFRDNEAYTVTEGASSNMMTLGFNNQSEVLSDQRVRQAIRQAINREELIEVIGGNADEVGSMVTPSDPWFVDLTDVAPYDPEAAKALLAEAGQENLSLTLKVSNTYLPIISEFIAAELEEVGIDLKIEQMEFAAWLDDVYTAKNYELTMVLHVDPTTLTYYGNPDYYWNYDNPEVQQLVAEAKEAASLEERDEKLRKVATIVSEESASDWLYAPANLTVANSKLSGYPTGRTADNLPLANITVSE